MTFSGGSDCEDQSMYLIRPIITFTLAWIACLIEVTLLLMARLPTFPPYRSHMAIDSNPDSCQQLTKLSAGMTLNMSLGALRNLASSEFVYRPSRGSSRRSRRVNQRRWDSRRCTNFTKSMYRQRRASSLGVWH